MADSNILPQIIYPSSVLAPTSTTTLNFTHQPRQQPSFILKGVRHDNTASSGVREVIFERMEQYWAGVMEYVAFGADVANWMAFEQSALQGIPFDYYADPINSPSVFVTYFVEDVEIEAAYRGPGWYKFKHKFYQYVGWP